MNITCAANDDAPSAFKGVRTSPLDSLNFAIAFLSYTTKIKLLLLPSNPMASGKPLLRVSKSKSPELISD